MLFLRVKYRRMTVRKRTSCREERYRNGGVRWIYCYPQNEDWETSYLYVSVSC